MGKLYGIGIGPGDPELLTIKAVKVIKSCDVVFLPSSKGFSLAEKVIEGYIKDKTRVYFDFPMGKDNFNNYKKAAQTIYSLLMEGKTGAFVTIGDALAYSTFIYLYRELERLDVEVEIIPGVPSFCAVFSKLKIPFSEKGQTVLISDKMVREESLNFVDSVILLKGSLNKDAINILKKLGFKFYYAKRIYLDGETIYTDEKDILIDDDYFSILIGKKE
ncbi:MAG: SAM-dependent methyltransferase [Thermovenabulum sp.]|uniref:SAM-dependent methyltransferase n=1 Tax=Thermovenabulum sp. TaxID=3100335 RepID=UPI003C7BF3FA